MKKTERREAQAPKTHSGEEARHLAQENHYTSLGKTSRRMETTGASNKEKEGKIIERLLGNLNFT